MKTTCSHPEGCDNPPVTEGLCAMHYKRLRRTGHIGPAGQVSSGPKKKNTGFCAHPEGCLKPAQVSGLCRTHYMRFRRHGELGSVELLKQRDRKCAHPDRCERKARLHGYCGMHAQRLQATGQLGPVERITLRHDDAPEGMRTCPRCRGIKLLTEFSPNRSRPSGIAHYCKVCMRRVGKKSRYGIEEPPSTKCDICGTMENLCIDHDHVSGLVRGTLCDDCNLSLGKMQDDLSRIEKAAAYLRKFKS